MIWHTNLKKNSLRKDVLLTPKKESTKMVQEGQTKTLMDLLRLYWQQYCEKSTIHGVRYIYDPTLRSIERLIWSALVITSVTLTCIAYGMLSERYSAQKLQTVVENSQYPVFQIPFPAVGVCPNNRINWRKFEAAKAEFLPQAAEPNLIEVFTTFVERMESLSFGQFESFAEMDDINLELLDDIDVSNLTKFMSLRCEDIFVNGECSWRRVPFNCCSFFIMERTELGYCFVFNSVVSPESLVLKEIAGTKYYPYHNSKAGQGSGLIFQIRLSEDMKRPNSKVDDTIMILIKRPEQLYSSGYTISPDTETYVIVRPEVTESSKDIRSLPQEQRHCFFDDENALPNYDFKSQMKIDRNLIMDNCLNVCHEQHLRKYCNCTLPLFFLTADASAEQCRPSHFRCLAKNNDIFSYDKRSEEDAYFSSAKPGMTCSCLIPCNIVEYYTSLTTLPLNSNANSTIDQFYKVDVHYQSEVVIKYRTSLEFTSIDLIANFGGIFGLCLGASMVSAVELLYYLTFGLALYLYDNNYYTVLKERIHTLRMKWAMGIRDTLNEDYDERTTTHSKLSFMHKRPQQKHNHW
ncbi:pickpocket 20 [Haematobia irritans]|uniref:pickpocket 20 n=1 Tax=Haematobia irritans TaxID=7368 RepID=UPI003F501004